MEGAIELYCPILKNITCSKIYNSFADNVTLHLIFITGIIFAVCGNLALIISILHFTQLHTPSNVLILSMAFCDFLIGVFNMPVHFLEITEVCWYKSSLFCFSHQFTYVSLTNISVYHLLLLAGDRYYAVCYPLFYSMKVTFKVIWILVAIVWSFSILYVFFSMYFVASLLSNAYGTEYRVNVLFIFSLYDYLVSFFLPFVIIFGLYAKIFTVARRHVKAIQGLAAERESGEQRKNNRFLRKQHKAAKTISIVIFIFILSWFPAYLYSFLGSFNLIFFFKKTYNILIEIGLLNSALNPIIYGFFYPWFWKAFKILVTCRIFWPESSTSNLFSKQ
uniref:G-protein coupled receptors family 1 profile domain-containing protein n=1 Tax=Erpetoichthys calabaricus TaxID=27687 RepID=A0A8C4RH41_ERPCA